MNAKKLFLFDLDGTLVSTGGAGLRALEKTFTELFQISDAVARVNPSGKTDPIIFREVVRIFFSRETSNEELALISSRYLANLEREIELTRSTRLLAGVLEFVNHVNRDDDILAGLGTGNLEKAARLKLSLTPLNTAFSFGGFGSDAEERFRVLEHGYQRGLKQTDRSIPKESVYVIGDTPLDVHAAREAGFRSVGVASGGYSYEQLSEFSPDFLLRDMTEAFSFLDKIK